MGASSVGPSPAQRSLLCQPGRVQGPLSPPVKVLRLEVEGAVLELVLGELHTQEAIVCTGDSVARQPIPCAARQPHPDSTDGVGSGSTRLLNQPHPHLHVF